MSPKEWNLCRLQVTDQIIQTAGAASMLHGFNHVFEDILWAFWSSIMVRQIEGYALGSERKRDVQLPKAFPRALT